MQPGARRAYIVLGIIGVIEIAALAVLWVAPSSKTPTQQGSITHKTTPMELTSSAFANNSSIPSKYTCDGSRDVSPPLTISNVPEGTKSLVLIVDDPDVPKALKADGIFDHWVLYDIPPVSSGTNIEIPEGGGVGTLGLNGAGKAAYTGPCPPKEYEPSEHRYIFTLYALDEGNWEFVAAPTKSNLLERMEGHVVVQAQLIGKYKKQ